MLNDRELYNVIGGASVFSATLVNAVARLIDTVIEAGRLLGTAVHMFIYGKSC